jgi:hypothetical protein
VREPAAFHAAIGPHSPLAGADVALRPTFVALSCAGGTALPRPNALAIAVSLAHMLAQPPKEKAGAFAPPLVEPVAYRFRQLVAVWDAFAAARELAYDRDSIAVHGLYGRCDMRMDLHVNGDSHVVDVAAALRAEARASVEVGREASRSWIARTLRPDLRTGDGPFDDAFWIRGVPDHTADEAVRALLAPTEVRTAVRRTMEWASSISVHGASVVAHAALAPATEQDVARAFDDVVALADHLAPAEVQAAPYR